MTRRATLSREEARRVLAAHVRDLALGVGVPDPVREAELRRIIDGPAVGDIGPQQVVLKGARAPEVRVQEREPGADIEEATDTRRRVPLWREGEGGELVPLDPHAARAAIAGAILAARGADGAPVLYSVSQGLGTVERRAGGAPQIKVVTDWRDLRIAMDEHVSVGVLVQKKDGVKRVWDNDHPSVTTRLEDLSRPSAWAAVRLQPPHLETVRAYPYFNRSGKLVNTVGYDPQSRCYLTVATHIERPAPGETPLTVLAEWMVDFIQRSFTAAHDMTYTMAMAVTLLCRDMIAGPTPLFAVTAAEHGTGKGKLVDSVARAVIGATPLTINVADEGDRIVAEIAAAVLSARPMVNLDNIPHTRVFGGPAIETVTTREEYQTRRLGTNELIDAPNRAVWCLTANNVRVTADTSRRVIWIRLVSREDGAAKRGGWQRADIDAAGGWTVRNRARILGAFVAIVERHLAAKAAGWTSPVSVWKPGSYEAWASVVGEALTHAGMPGWGDGISDSAAAADPVTTAYRQLAEKVLELHFTERGNADSAQFYVKGPQMAAIVVGIEHWGNRVDRIFDKTGTAMCRLAWEISREVVGRVWVFEAEGARRAGTLTFKAVQNIGGTVGVFQWEMRA